MSTQSTLDRLRAVALGVFATVLLGSALSGCAGSSTAANPAGSVTTAAPKPSPSSQSPTLSLVVVGDSIPFNFNCPGCTGFVDQYAAALGKATGEQVETSNLSEDTGLDLPGLMAELPDFKDQLSSADAIIVGIAHNTIELNVDRPCGSGRDPARGYAPTNWSKITQACSDRSVARWRPVYDKLYSTVAGWRAGKPTILLTIDKYDDTVGFKPAHLTAHQTSVAVMFHDAWNTMLCHSAETNGFACADVYHAFNGPRGTRPLGNLVIDDYTHPSQEGDDVIARALISKGFAPLA